MATPPPQARCARSALWRSLALGALLTFGCPPAATPIRPDEQVFVTQETEMTTSVPAEIVRYPSGLTALVQTNRSTPVVAMQLWVRVGSGDELATEAGLAHVHEHMLFKGTASRPVGAIARDIESVGGSINAWTSFDQTVYHLVVPSRYAGDGLDVLLDAVRNSAFDPTELAKELDVIQEEIRRAEDLPARALNRLLFDAAYAAHPYGRPVIGTAESVARFTRDDVLAFYRRWYVPANMILVVVGDIGRPDVDTFVNLHFGDEASPPVPARPRPAEPEQTELRTAVEFRDTQDAHLAVAFHVPDLAAADTPALELLSVLLGQGESSLLFEHVQRRAALTQEVYSYLYAPAEPGILMLGATFRGGEVPQDPLVVLDAIVAEIARVRDLEFGPADVRRAQTILESDTIYQRQTVQGVAQRLGYFETVAGGAAFESRFLALARRATAADLRRVARLYLRPENMTVAMVLPQTLSDADLSTDAVRARVERRLAAASAETAQVDIAPDRAGAVRSLLPNGLVVVVQPDPTAPMFSVRAAVLAGLLAEDSGSNGAGNLVANLLTSGTATRSAAAIALEIDGIAASMSGFSGRNTIGLRMTALSRDFDRALELFSDALMHSTFPAGEVERVKREALADIAAQQDNLGGSAFQLFNERAFAGHPYAMNVLGTAGSVGGLTREELLEYYARMVQPSRMVVSIVGDVDPERAIRALSVLLAPTAPAAPRGLEAAAPPADVRAPVVGVEARDRQQVHVVLGYQTESLRGPNRYALDVLGAVLGGQGGRLFVELRDRQGLAYSVNAYSSCGFDFGTFAFYIATSPAKLGQAVEGLRAESAAVAELGITEAELERAKRFLVGRRDIGLQRHSARAGFYTFDELYGLGYDAGYDYAERLDAVSLDDVQRAAALYFRREREIVTVVGPAAATDIPPAVDAAPDGALP